jgi:hypothetical protein
MQHARENQNEQDGAKSLATLSHSVCLSDTPSGRNRIIGGISVSNMAALLSRLRILTRLAQVPLERKPPKLVLGRTFPIYKSGVSRKLVNGGKSVSDCLGATLVRLGFCQMAFTLRNRRA